MKCKCIDYLYLSLFALLGLLCGSSIINAENNVSAAEFSFTDLSLINNETLVSSPLYFGHSEDLLDFVPTYVSFTFSSSGTLPAATTCYSLFEYYSFMTKSSSSNLNYSSLCLPTSFDSSITYYFPLYFDSFLDSSNNFQHRYINFSRAIVSLSSLTFYDYNPLSSSSTGSLSIISNGEYDVSSYATAVVEVPDTETIVYGDYHDDLIKIYNGIMACAGTALVIYFFYCIYRIIIKNTGAK